MRMHDSYRCGAHTPRRGGGPRDMLSVGDGARRAMKARGGAIYEAAKRRRDRACPNRGRFRSGPGRQQGVRGA